MPAKSEKIAAMSKDKSAKRVAEVLKSISDMVASGEKVTFYSVQKATGAAKSFLYSNEQVRTAIEEARASSSGRGRSDESKDAVIKALRLQNERLQKELAAVKAQAGDSYKAKYERVLAENQELKQQLKIAYKY